MSVDWDHLLARLLHPTQAAILGAVEWIDEPLSPKLLVAVFDHSESLGTVAYHVQRLAALDALTLVDTAKRRGATEHFYRLTERG